MSRPVSVWVMDKRLRRCYEKAKVDLPEGGLFHAWRMKWATERGDWLGSLRDPPSSLTAFDSVRTRDLLNPIQV